MTETPRFRLEKLLEDLELPVSGDRIHKVQMQVGTECAVEMIEAMGRLTVAVNDMAKGSEAASKESGKVAVESANLSRKLNRLTFWIVAAAIGSAAAAIVQAAVAVHTVMHNPHP